MSHSMSYDLERDEETLTLDVEFNYIKAHRGYRNSLGVPEEPDEPDEIEIEGITAEKGNEVNVTDEEVEAIEGACLEYINEGV